MAKGILKIKMIGDASDLDKSLGGVTGSLGKLGGLAAGVFAGAQVVDFFKGAVSGASDLEESASKVGEVFGDAADGVKKFASTAATSMGMSEATALEATGTFGNLMVSLGMGGKEAASMSTEMVQLAADMGSFNNVPTEEALAAIRSGLVGENEPLKRFGVNMNEATLKAKAMELGLSDGKGTLDANAKAQAAYALIMEQTTTAQGDFARTSDGLSNSQKTMAAVWTDMKASLGEALMPVIMQFVGFIKDNMPVISDIFAGIGSVISGLAPTVQTVLGVIAEVLEAIKSAWSENGTELMAIITPIWEAIKAIIETVMKLVGAVIKTVMAIITGDWSAAWDGIKSILSGVWDLIKGIVKLALDILKGIISGVLSAIKAIWGEIWNGIKALGESIWNGIKDAALAAFSSMKALVGAIWDGIKAAWDAMWGAMKDLWNTASSWISGIPGKIKGLFSDAWNWLTSAGKAIIQGLWNGLTAVWKKVEDWGKGLYKKITGWIHFSGGPLYETGIKTMEGLGAGLKDGWKDVQKLGFGLNDALPGAFGGSGSRAASSGAANIGGVTIYIQGQGTAAGEAAGNAFLNTLAAAGVRL